MRLLFFIFFLASVALAKYKPFIRPAEPPPHEPGDVPGKIRCNKKHGKYCSRNRTEDLDPGVACREISMIWAQGTYRTTSLQDNNTDNLGGLVADEIGMKLGYNKIALQGLHYINDKDVKSEPGPLVLGGANQLVYLLNTTATRCPSTKIVVGGTEQGAKVIHQAMNHHIWPELAKKIRGVLLFDDPYFTYPDTYGNSSMGVIADDDILGNIVLPAQQKVWASVRGAVFYLRKTDFRVEADQLEECKLNLDKDKYKPWDKGGPSPYGQPIPWPG